MSHILIVILVNTRTLWLLTLNGKFMGKNNTVINFIFLFNPLNCYVLLMSPLIRVRA